MTDDKAHLHGHPGQREPRSQGETRHELRRMNLDIGIAGDLRSGGAEL